MLVAVSGGADSVALLDVLVRAGYSCIAAHCNFHLRGAESDRDEAFVRELCAHMNVPLEVQDFDTQRYAAQQKVSIEVAARELRYTWFGEIARAFVAYAECDRSVRTLWLRKEYLSFVLYSVQRAIISSITYATKGV